MTGPYFINIIKENQNLFVSRCLTQKKQKINGRRSDQYRSGSIGNTEHLT
jgi:hypothetical protein